VSLRVLHTAASPALAAAGDLVPVENDGEGGRETLRGLYAPPAETWLRLNLIAAVSGDAAGEDGTSDTLSNAVDRAVLAVVRDLADGVVVGAASVRLEGYRVPKTSRLVVVTSSGDLSGHRMDPAEAARVVVVCPSSATAAVTSSLGAEVARAATVLVVDDVGGRLRDHGLRSLVCEGGPSLAGQFLRDGLVDELCLSTSPVAIGSGLPVFGRERFDPARLSLSQLLKDDHDALYARWLVAGGPASR
jgi:riboflavin biosynthesis pyrimidine reductase